MGKKLVIKGADFSENGFFYSLVNYDEYNLLNGTLAAADHSWVNSVSTTGSINKHILVNIPNDATAIKVDASEILETLKGKTASGSKPIDDVIIYFLTGIPEDTTNGTVEPKFVERHLVSIGDIADIDIPSTATVMMVHTGYWANNLTAFYTSRIPKKIVFR